MKMRWMIVCVIGMTVGIGVLARWSTQEVKNNLVVTTLTPVPTRVPTQKLKIVIKGDEWCQREQKASLDLLRQKVPDHFANVEKYIGVVECTASQSGVFAWEVPPRIQVGRGIMEAGSIWNAGGLVHEACHSKLYNDYWWQHKPTPVPEYVWAGREVEQRCIDIQVEALGQMGASAETIQYAINSINSNFWEVKYSERWW